MKQQIKYLYTLFCLLVVSILFPASVHAQVPTKNSPGEAIEISLTIHNSIVWGNVFESPGLSGNKNLVNEDPLFASETDFALQMASPAIGEGDNSVWENLNDTDPFDIAGVYRANPMNIGAFESGAEYKVTFDVNSNEGSVIAYIGGKAISDGDLFSSGTELTVVATALSGYRLESLTANGGTIQNGETYILTGHTTFAATFVTTSRKDVYATFRNGGNLKAFNNIIYDNVDTYGNYSLDNTNVIANPSFADATSFTLQPESPAIGTGDGNRLPAGSVDIAGISFEEVAVDAGAYQTGEFLINWNSTGNGTLEVFKVEVNADNETIKTELSGGETIMAGVTIFVRATPATGYILTSLKVNGAWINLADADKDPEKNPLLREGTFPLSGNMRIEAVFTNADNAGFAVNMQSSSTVVNNIIYDNLHSQMNIADDPVNPRNLTTTNPLFTGRTNFKPQSTSVAINKGINSAVMSQMVRDLAGSTRIQGNIVDMGAYESTSEGFTVTYSSEILSKAKTVATVQLLNMDNGNSLVTSGDIVPAGTRLKVAVTIPDNHYEMAGRIKVTANNTDTYLDANQFVLEGNSQITVRMRGKEYAVNYTGTNGAVIVTSNNNPVASGAKVSYDTYLNISIIPEKYHNLQFVSVNGQHIEGAELGGGYIVRVTGETTIMASCVPVYELNEDGEPSDPGNPQPASPKGLFIWDALNAVVTAKVNGSDITSGALLNAGDVVSVTISPVNSSYGIALLQHNGTDLPKTQTSFRFTIPDASGGSIETTFFAIRYTEDGWKPGNNPNPGTDPNPVTVYHTLTVEPMPEGITINPEVGSHQIEAGSSRTLRIEVDEALRGNNIFLRINEEYILLDAPYAYTLLDIREDITIGIVVTESPDPNPDPVGNMGIKDATRIWTGTGAIHIETPKPGRVFIYTMQGRLYTEQRIAEGETMIYVPAGVYVVVLPEIRKTEKIIVGN